MTDSNRYKFLRRGGSPAVRAGSTRGSSRSGSYAESANIVAPTIEEFGNEAFTEEHRHDLSQRLQDAEWPRGTLNIFGLEGLLTALLVLPLGLRPGAWMPFIWNERGWKIPVALQGEDQYDQFVDSVVGLLRMIDNGLLETPPRFISSLDALSEAHRSKTVSPYEDWARGFGIALTQSNFLNISGDSDVFGALRAIAVFHDPSAAVKKLAGVASALKLRQAVLELAKLRTSRGPLGPLPASTDSTDKDNRRAAKGRVPALVPVSLPAL